MLEVKTVRNNKPKKKKNQWRKVIPIYTFIIQ